MRLTEAQIQKTCSDFMAADGWRSLRTDPTSDRSRGKGFGEIGMADHLFIRYAFLPVDLKASFQESEKARWAEIIWVEFKKLDKAGKPTKATVKQVDWHVKERAIGALTVIAGVDFPATVDGFIQWYAGSGLARKVGR